MVFHQQNKAMYNLYGEQYHAKRQDEQANLWNKFLDVPSMTKLIKKHVNGCNVLDLGCGSGIFAAQVRFWGGKVVGLDQSSTMINIARRENPEIDFYLGNAETMPFKEQQFDVVYSCLMIHSFQELGPLFAEVARVICPSGRFIFSCHHPFNEILDEVGNGSTYKVTMRPYFHNEEYRWKMFEGMELVSYHHTFETIFKALNQTGFVVDNLIETTPSELIKNKYPEFLKEPLNIRRFVP